MPPTLKHFWPSWLPFGAGWATAAFTALLVIVGFLTAIVLIVQVGKMTTATQAAESAANAAKTQADAFIAIESPVIIFADKGGIELIKWDPVELAHKITEGVVPKQSTINVVVRNVGRSAGTITGVDFHWSVGAGPPPESSEYTSYKVELTLAPGAEHTFDLGAYLIELTGTELTNMQHGATLQVRGSVNYLDLLGKPRKLRFSVYWNQSRGFVS